MIRRLLIANRGEIALRIIAACRELRIETVAVYSTIDRSAPHVGAADRAIEIGPAPAVESYLSIPRIVEAARTAGADAVHPGYGFLSENAAFAEACASAGLAFVGPPPGVIARLGSKIAARRLAAAAGIPVVPGETPEDQSDAGIRRAIERVGLPALVKASAGGGGKGMRLVRDATEVLDAVQAARREATSAVGDGTLYVERLIEAPHHVEVQILADRHSRTIHLFERECSVQRRHQKVIEESPSLLLTDRLRATIAEAAVAFARAAGYQNAGTVEFLVDASALGDDLLFYFLEMNTRLQVEHPVTEQVTGLDLVHAQLRIAAGEPLPWTQAEVSQRGHAIEARVYAEDPSQGFLPQAGRIVEYREPRLPGIRIDSGVTAGSEISVHYDPMLAKVIATAETRALAIDRLAAALRAFNIGGIRTNVAFLLRILDLVAFRSGTMDTAFLDREGARLVEQLRESPTEARSTQSPLHHESPIPNPESRPRGSWDPWTGTSARAAQAVAARRARSRGGPNQKSITAPMPATVIKVPVKNGDAVRKGDVLVLLEAMKMELPLRAPADAVIARVNCKEGDLVQADATLLEFQ